MKHLTETELLRYVKDEGLDEMRTKIESHLYVCDECLTTYMHVLELEKPMLPSLDDTTTFTEGIMQEIVSANKVQKGVSHTHQKKEHPFHKRTFIHYLVAAAMTIIFMSVGVFESFTGYVREVHATTFAENKPSITEQIIETIYKDKKEREEE